MKKKSNTSLFVVLLAVFLCNTPAWLFAHDETEFSIPQAISSADIIRTTWPDTAVISLYQGNGRFGSMYGPLGLQLDPGKPEWLKYGLPQYLHIKHFCRAKFGVDYLLPLACIFWQDRPKKVTGYSQHQSFYDGTITTRFTEENNSITVMTWFDAVERDLCAIKINVQGQAPAIILDPFKALYVHYRQELYQTPSIDFKAGIWEIKLSCLNANSTLFLQTNANVNRVDNSLHINLHEGENTILLSVNARPKATLKKSLARTVKWWHKKWQNMGCLRLPDLDAQRMWVRTMAYIFYSHNEDKTGMAPPMGFTGHGWPFVFPGDLTFLPPVLLASGNLSIAKSWVEYLAERLDDMKKYTRRLFGVDGLFCPGTIPYAGFAGFHDPSPPTKNYYSINVSGLLARMTDETAAFVNDGQWKQKFAEPIIRETAIFYRSISNKEADGYWHLFITPSTGLDENGGFNQKDYLCALFSAQYCFQKAIEYGLDSDGLYRQILQDGLAFPTLMPERGYYYTNQGAKNEQAGAQKHPVQLNPLALLPIYPHVSEPAATAYNLRYKITINAEQPHFAGWTLAEFLLAGTHMNDVAGWKKDWDNLIRSNIADADMIQTYESSGNNRAFYVTTMGMIAQSLTCNLVDDWFGTLEIARCNPWQGKIYLKNIYSRLGVSVSGEIDKQMATLSLTAWKDCDFDMHGMQIKMKKGKTQTTTLKLKTLID